MPSAVSRAPDERRVADRLGRGQQQQSLGCLRQLTGALEIVILEVAREVCRREKLEAACQLRCAHAPRQIEQSERVAAGFRDDAVADAVVEPTRDGSHEQGARILLSQPAQQQLGQAVEVVPGIRLADGDHDRHRFRQQPSRDEAEDHSRGGVQPLSVLHETEQRPLLGRGRQQAEHGESDQEPVRDVAGCEAQGDIQRVLLRLRQRVELVEQRRAELMDPGERQLHLRLHARDLRHTESRGTTSGVPKQRRLSDARLASDDEDGALTLAHVCQEPVEHFALAGPVKKPGRKGGGHLAGNANRSRRCHRIERDP